MRVLITVAFLALSSFVPAQSAKSGTDQAPQNVDLCELIHHPQKYDGHTVRVRGHVVFEFEDFSLDDSGCRPASVPTHETGVWLTFGGDQPEIAAFCCGLMRRDQGVDFEVAGHKVGLVRDANFRLFLNQISARRLRRPDGRECYDQCKFYQVTATLTGLFAQSKGDGGYGHFGMFHLLVIHAVEHVSAERTLVPFGGIFQCLEEKWEPAPGLRQAVADSLKCANFPESDCGPERRFNLVASHWNDPVNRGFQTEVYSDMNGDQISNWVSSDLLTSYFTHTKEDGRVSVTRGHCTPSSQAPAPSSTSIACDEHRRTLDEATDREVDRLLAKNDFTKAWTKEAEGAQRLYTDGDQSWRVQEPKAAAWHVLLGQSRDWDISPDPTLQFAECADASTEESPVFMGCNWYSPDGAQTFSVSLFKPRLSADEQVKSPWLVTSVDAEVCRAVSE